MNQQVTESNRLLIILMFIPVSICVINLSPPERCGNNFTSDFLYSFYKLIYWALPIKLVLGECHRTPLMKFSIVTGNGMVPLVSIGLSTHQQGSCIISAILIGADVLAPCKWHSINRLERPCLLTHWGRVTHICVCKQTSIGSDNGLSPGRCQAIIWTNAGILLIGPLGTTSVKF